jgi:steroid 5-alpha reductase family enzyme
MSAKNSRIFGLLLCLVAYLVATGAAAIVHFVLPGKHPILIAAIGDFVATVVVFVFSRLTNNSSMYDPYWSVAPLVIAPYFAFGPWAAGANRSHIFAAFLVVGFWGVRLTYNWARRWKGLADEDFRYVDQRRKHGRRYWVVSFLGIHLFPTILVFLGCLPLYYAATSKLPFNALDSLGLLIASIAIWFEATADRQLHAFSQSPREPGSVLATGLWRYSRHPNYFGEILFWWGVLAFGLAGSTKAWWTGIGALAITALFKFVSVPLIDKRMLEKRPHYAANLRSTNAIFPWWPRRS